MKRKITSDVAHRLSEDLQKALETDESALERWNDITPLARNEWICWVVSTKKPKTRKNHIKRTITELLQGKRRPCCWAGCIHRSK